MRKGHILDNMTKVPYSSAHCFSFS